MALIKTATISRAHEYLIKSAKLFIEMWVKFSTLNDETNFVFKADKRTTFTYIVQPREFSKFRIWIDFALKVDVITLFNIACLELRSEF